jgi:hypothetical protein
MRLILPRILQLASYLAQPWIPSVLQPDLTSRSPNFILKSWNVPEQNRSIVVNDEDFPKMRPHPDTYNDVLCDFRKTRNEGAGIDVCGAARQASSAGHVEANAS